MMRTILPKVNLNLAMLLVIGTIVSKLNVVKTWSVMRNVAKVEVELSDFICDTDNFAQ